MSELKRFQKLVDDVWELVFGTARRPEVKFEGMYTDKKPKRKRARKADGRYRGDDKSTPDVNEAWEDSIGEKNE
jgi:hypothetical protein